jgi:hypothetical protein
MSQPARHEIEKLATKAFAVAHERIAVERAEKRNQVLSEVARRGNIGGYVPALTKWATEGVREGILALADAYVDAFTLAEAPADAEVEKALETSSLQIAGGAISGVRGELDLISTRTRQPLNRGAGHIGREVEKSRVSALNEAQLKLERQRMKAKITAREDSWARGQSVATHLSHAATAPSSRPRNRRACRDDEETAVQRREFIGPFLLKETLSGVATRSGVGYSSLYRWRSGETRLSPENRNKLADHLKVDLTRIPN